MLSEYAMEVVALFVVATPMSWMGWYIKQLKREIDQSTKRISQVETTNQIDAVRLNALEDRSNKVDGKLDKILDMLSDMKVELANKADQGT